MEELDTLSKAGIESERARAAFYRCVNVGMTEFAAFEVARDEECQYRLAHINAMAVDENQDELRWQMEFVHALPNPFARRKGPRDAQEQAA